MVLPMGVAAVNTAADRGGRRGDRKRSTLHLGGDPPPKAPPEYSRQIRDE